MRMPDGAREPRSRDGTEPRSLLGFVNDGTVLHGLLRRAPHAMRALSALAPPRCLLPFNRSREIEEARVERS